jgi:phospholipase C
MPKDLSRIDTIVIVMMENRSFDHLLGYLGLPESGHPNGARIDGIQHARLYYANDPCPPRPLTSSNGKPDPPHERDEIEHQIHHLLGPMKGFADAYVRKHPRADPARVMEYCTRGNLPITDFLARNFAVCDNWFAALPASTLPNRLMAASGYTLVDSTPENYLQIARNLFLNNPDDLVYDWLAARRVSWRLYFSGSFFFMQMRRIMVKYQRGLGSRFRSITRLRDDFRRGDVPQVVFIEPRYQDDPRRGSAQATDDHPPASLWGGQRFLKQVYEAIASPAVWERLVAVVTYDEHGGFFDHIPPPRIATQPPPGADYSKPFETLGVRVPAIVVSPFVAPGQVFEGLLDHISVLKFLGERFGGGSYTPLVDSRPVSSVSDALVEELLAPDHPARHAPTLP